LELLEGFALPIWYELLELGRRLRPETRPDKVSIDKADDETPSPEEVDDPKANPVTEADPEGGRKERLVQASGPQRRC
jgi:hypothetical protein